MDKTTLRIQPGLVKNNTMTKATELIHEVSNAVVRGNDRDKKIVMGRVQSAYNKLDIDFSTYSHFARKLNHLPGIYN